MEEKDTITLSPKQWALVVAAIIAIAGGGPSLVNKFSTEARHDPFTGREGAALKQYCDREIAELRAEVIDLKHQWHKHTVWGREINERHERWRGKIDAEHEQFHRLLRSQ